MCCVNRCLGVLRDGLVLLDLLPEGSKVPAFQWLKAYGRNHPAMALHRLSSDKAKR